MLEPWRMAAPIHLRLAPKFMYMPAETMTGKPTERFSVISLTDSKVAISGRYLSRDQVFVTKQAPVKVEDVSTKRNTVENY